MTGRQRRKPTSTYEVVDGCWLWQGVLNSSGYGPHREFWTDANGPIPMGLVVDHLCRQRSCVNPEHMELVTHSENLRRRPTCREGHEWTEESTYSYKGYRLCRICRAARAREFRRRVKEAA